MLVCSVFWIVIIMLNVKRSNIQNIQLFIYSYQADCCRQALLRLNDSLTVCYTCSSSCPSGQTADILNYTIFWNPFTSKHCPNKGFERSLQQKIKIHPLTLLLQPNNHDFIWILTDQINHVFPLKNKSVLHPGSWRDSLIWFSLLSGRRKGFWRLTVAARR